MARDNEEKRVRSADNGRQPRPAAAPAVSADDIRRLVAKLKGEEAKK